MSVFCYQVYQARLWEPLLTSRTWYSIYQFTHCFTLQTSDYDVIFDFLCWFSVISDVIHKVQRHHGLIKATCRETDNVYQATRNNELIWEVTDKHCYLIVSSPSSLIGWKCLQQLCTNTDVWPCLVNLALWYIYVKTQMSGILKVFCCCQTALTKVMPSCPKLILVKKKYSIKRHDKTIDAFLFG